MKQEDLDAISNPKTYQPGPGRDKANLAYYSKRASENSQQATRASDGPMVLPNTEVKMRDTAMRPKEQRKVDAAMAGKDPAEHNHVSTRGDYMPNVRRKV